MIRIAGLLAISLALLAAAAAGARGKAEEKLRIAWASQYEWRESGVTNTVLEFTYTRHWKGVKEDQEWSREGKGQVVVDGSGIVRRHFPGADENRQKSIEAHLAWIAGRFVREPFEKRFENMVFEGPEKSPEGHLRVTAAPKEDPTNRSYFLLRDDRLIGREIWRGMGANPPFNRVTYTLGDVDDAYMILGEDVTHTNDEGKKSTVARDLTIESNDKCAYPRRYDYTNRSSFGTSTVRIDFSPPTVNAKHPIVGDPAARDALKQAWERRHVLPGNLRIEAEFQRRIDKHLVKLHWVELVKGTLRVWGLDEISVDLDERLFRGESWTATVKKLCEGHIRGVFRWMRDDPFEEEFKECGFAFIREGDEVAGVYVFGYGPALGFLLKDGKISGYRRNTAEEEDWWRFRLKKTRDGKARIESMSTKFGRKSMRLAIKYARHKGLEIPRSFEVLGGPRWGGSEEEGRGVAEYSLKKIKVTRPGKG